MAPRRYRPLCLPQRHLETRVAPLVLALALALAAPALGEPTAAPPDRPPPAPRVAPPDADGFIWRVETLDGEVLAARGSDRRFNPASVVKVATSLVALERLGPDHVFETRFFLTGPLDKATGVVDGDLVVLGGGDPEFLLENAFSVAERLALRGVRAIGGRVLVDERFWLGWEGGSEGRRDDPVQRMRLMAWRLERALDPTIWSDDEREAWALYLEARGRSPVLAPPRVEAGGYGHFDGAVEGPPTLTHRGKPLGDALRRFNAWSNNDIERVGELLGGPDVIAAHLEERLPTGGDITLETTSGLGINRMTIAQVIALVRALREAAAERGLALDDVLPRAGCTEGTLENFEQLHEGPYAAAVAGKTGTLAVTDGGVSIFAGVASTARGDLVFAVAKPRSGHGYEAARVVEEAFVVDLIDSFGGPRERTCPDRLPLPLDGTAVLSGTRAELVAVQSPPADTTRRQLAGAWGDSGVGCAWR